MEKKTASEKWSAMKNNFSIKTEERKVSTF
jgi:hypothetical protein